MIDLPLLLAFTAAASVLTITPGVDTAIVIRAATVDGRQAGVRAALGVALGCLIWGAAVSLGLGVILQASEVAYALLKIAGAAYLSWIGLKLLIKPRTRLNASTEVTSSRYKPAHDAFWRGFLTNMLNPKVGVFYITFLPQFVPAGANVAVYSLLLACLHIALSLVWFAMLIAATAPLTQLLSRPSSLKLMDRITGSIFIAFGLKLAASSPR